MSGSSLLSSASEVLAGEGFAGDDDGREGIAGGGANGEGSEERACCGWEAPPAEGSGEAESPNIPDIMFCQS